MSGVDWRECSSCGSSLDPQGCCYWYDDTDEEDK